MRCPNCGHENGNEAKYCENCGSELPHYDYNREALLNLKKLRRIRLNIVTNRVLLIASLIALILLFVSIFLPVIKYPMTDGSIEYGGMAWFIKNGWDLYFTGQISTGPFITTFVVYILNAIVTLTLGAFALTSIIKSFRERKGFMATQYLIAIFVSNFIYINFILNFYYEYYSLNNSYFETSQGSGYFLFELARVAFFIPFIIHIILNGIYNTDPNNKLKIILASIPAYFLFTSYGDYFNSIGFTDYFTSETYLYGLSKYLDPTSVTFDMPAATLTAQVICFIFTLIAFITSIANFMFIIHDIYKTDSVNTKRLLALSITQFVSTFGLVISGIVFAETLNLVPGISDVHININVALLGFMFYATAMLTVSIILFVRDKTRKEYTIIDNN